MGRKDEGAWGIAGYRRRRSASTVEKSRWRVHSRNWLVWRSRIHFLQLSFDVTARKRSVDGDGLGKGLGGGELFSGSGYSRARRKQGERVEEEEEDGEVAETKVTSFRGKFFLPAFCHRETVYAAISSWWHATTPTLNRFLARPFQTPRIKALPSLRRVLISWTRVLSSLSLSLFFPRCVNRDSWNFQFEENRIAHTCLRCFWLTD